jgi:dsDNA-specific endonuclease/ATPase MutS2
MEFSYDISASSNSGPTRDAYNVTPNSILLFNESFAATNEREGAEIARQIISALLEKRIKVFFVTHSYECAHSFYDKEMENAIFLRAERQPDGVRTLKLLEGEPLQTSYGQDLYNKNIYIRNRRNSAAVTENFIISPFFEQ